MYGRYLHAAATGNIGPTGKGATLLTVNVNKQIAAAILTIYDGQDATGTVVAVIDASVQLYRRYDVYCPNGVFAVLSGANADVTIGAQ